MSVTLVQPVSAIATRISASISLSDVRDARSSVRCERIGPGAAEQDEVGAKREHPNDVETERTPPSARTGMRPCNRVGNSGQGAGASTTLRRAVVRHDWKRQSRPLRSGRGARVLGIKDALDDEWAVPMRANPFDVLPADGRIEIGMDPRLEVAQRGAFSDDGLKIAKADGAPANADVPQSRLAEQ